MRWEQFSRHGNTETCSSAILLSADGLSEVMRDGARRGRSFGHQIQRRFGLDAVCGQPISIELLDAFCTPNPIRSPPEVNLGTRLPVKLGGSDHVLGAETECMIPVVDRFEGRAPTSPNVSRA